jgi:SAM-dependent MidA family methyltransferase
MSIDSEAIDRWLAREGIAPLSDEERATSAALSQLIQGEIEAAGGRIPFRRFMEMALYTPQLGYYTGGRRKFGTAGDFVTAPEISPLFGRCLARQCAEILEQSGGGILEFGAGSGRLAVDLFRELERLGAPPARYAILELSPDLQALQRQTITQELPEYLDRFEWLEQLPEGFRGVMLANEVVDAMPVHRFRITGNGPVEEHVLWSGEAFVPAWSDDTPGVLGSEIAELALELPLDYISEINLAASAWIHHLAGQLDRGAVILIDYGYSRSEYYHPERSSGTLLCHFRHRAHGEALILPGLQDITAHIDFTALARAALTADMQVAGYATQGNFLINCGLDELLQQLSNEDSRAFLQQIQQVKTLTLPNMMGERFKVLALSRNISDELMGFQRQDLRHKL